MSPTMASRGAPRIPLPTRSENRAASTSDEVGARAKRGLDKAPRPYPISVSALRLPSLSLTQPEKSLEFDDAKHLGAGAQHRCEKHRQKTVDHLGRDVHEQADEAERPDAAGQSGKR